MVPEQSADIQAFHNFLQSKSQKKKIIRGKSTNSSHFRDKHASIYRHSLKSRKVQFG